MQCKIIFINILKYYASVNRKVRIPFKKRWNINSFRVILIKQFYSTEERNRCNDMSSEQEKLQKRKDESAVREMISWIITLALAVVAALFVKNYVIINANIPSGSMENTIMTGDRLFGFRLAYRNSSPERGDIIIFKFPDDETENYVKRVIGLPGETVEIEDAKIYIDGSEVPLQEDYLKEEWTVETGPLSFEVPEDSYLVLGDNRNNSYDARYWDNQFVSKDKILGKAVFRYYPFSNVGSLY